MVFNGAEREASAFQDRMQAASVLAGYDYETSRAKIVRESYSSLRGSISIGTRKPLDEMEMESSLRRNISKNGVSSGKDFAICEKMRSRYALRPIKYHGELNRRTFSRLRSRCNFARFIIN